MTGSPKEIALELLAALSAKDLTRMNAVLADDATLYDPHYQPPLMTGRAAINAGMQSEVGFLKRMNWKVLRSWEAADSVVLEVDTEHEMPDGTRVTPRQVFVVDVRNGKVTHWQSFVPYPPPLNA